MAGLAVGLAAGFVAVVPAVPADVAGRGFGFGAAKVTGTCASPMSIPPNVAGAAVGFPP